MIVDLAPQRAASPGRSSPNRESTDVSIREWEENDFASTARIIHESYRGEHDSRINSQYASEEGCAELLSVLTEHLWCGDFLPRVSRVAVSGSGKRVGVLIASRIAEGVGHISQISILPDYQGRGIGRRMICEALARFSSRGFNKVSLAVTATNANAFHLYRSCGFRTRHCFPVFYREKH
jgi:ribosomal protein S18 acetylase RimI-like enzyme